MIKARIFYDAMGNPEDFVRKYLDDLIGKVKEYEGVNVLEIEKLDPVKNGELYSMVAILTVEFEDLQKLFEFILDYPPSTIEIIEPEGPEELLKDLEKKIDKLSEVEKSAKKETKELIKEIRKELKAIKTMVPTRSFLNLLLNDLLAKQHQLGLLLKNLQAENILLKQKLMSKSGGEENNKPNISFKL